MATDLLTLFRTLSSFAPARGTSLKDAPWESFVDWTIAHGLGPLAAYNLEYRLAGAGAPEWVRERLLSVYQGTLNDNVMKLVSFKRAVTELQGRKLLLFGAASNAEALYPHAAFRPVTELHLLLKRNEPEGFAGYLKRNGFVKLAGSEGAEGSEFAVSDDHATLLLYSGFLGEGREAVEAEILGRAIPTRVYGPSVSRPDVEDAVLLAVYEQAKAGFEVPFITFVDLRELLLGAPSLVGPYSEKPPKAEVLRERAKAMGLERALYASLSVTARLFPETEALAKAALPKLGLGTRKLLDAVLVAPLSQLSGVRATRGLGRVRAWLTASGGVAKSLPSAH